MKDFTHGETELFNTIISIIIPSIQSSWRYTRVSEENLSIFLDVQAVLFWLIFSGLYSSVSGNIIK
jgi:hypothetical protein